MLHGTTGTMRRSTSYCNSWTCSDTTSRSSSDRPIPMQYELLRSAFTDVRRQGRKLRAIQHDLAEDARARRVRPVARHAHDGRAAAYLLVAELPVDPAA